jgi:hypothetical protein
MVLSREPVMILDLEREGEKGVSWKVQEAATPRAGKGGIKTETRSSNCRQ